MRLMECLRLRVKDIDFELHTLTLHETKSNRDRVTVLPQAVMEPLRLHLKKVKNQHEEDLANGFGRVALPGALARKYPNADYEWGWQYVFPVSRLSRDPRSGLVQRHHLYETSVQKAIRRAAKEAGIEKPVRPHTFRHSFATHLLQAGTDIRKIQEILGHKDLKTMMVYTHVAGIGAGVKSPLDSLDIRDPLGVCWRSHGWRARVTKGETQGTLGPSPCSQSKSLARFMAAAEAVCCKCVRARPIYLAERRPVRRTLCEIVLSIPARHA